LYWLGRDIEIGALSYRGPSYALTGAANTEDRIDIDYVATLADGGAVALSVDQFTPAAWGTAERNYAGPFPGVIVRESSATVAGRDAKIYEIRGLAGPGRISVVIDAGDTIIACWTVSSNPAKGTPEPNRLLELDILLATLEGLRPYPQ
jgi:hypothetical protein